MYITWCPESYYCCSPGISRSHSVMARTRWWPPLFGVGAALTLDEFALWLHLRDVYWERAGRRSVDVVLAAAAVGTLVVLGLDFWEASWHAFTRLVRRAA